VALTCSCFRCGTDRFAGSPLGDRRVEVFAEGVVGPVRVVPGTDGLDVLLVAALGVDPVVDDMVAEAGLELFGPLRTTGLVLGAHGFYEQRKVMGRASCLHRVGMEMAEHVPTRSRRKKDPLTVKISFFWRVIFLAHHCFLRE